MTLKKKILAGYGIAFALMGIVILWAVSNLIALGRVSDMVLRENYRSILAAENMVNALERQDRSMLLLFLGDGTQGVANFRASEADFLEWLVRARDNVTIQGEAELCRSIESDYTKYRSLFSELTDLGSDSVAQKTPIPTTALSTYQELVFPLFSRVRESCQRLRSLNEETMYAAGLKADRNASIATWSSVLLAVAALILVLAFSLLLAERILGPVRHVMNASRKISEGDYTVRVPKESGDELGQLAGEFNQMAERLGRCHEMNSEQIIAEKNKGDAILASIGDALLVFDTTLNITAANPAARHLLDLEFREGTQPTCGEILPETNICDLMRKCIETGAPPEIAEQKRVLTLNRAGAARRWLFSLTAVRGRGRERRLSGVVLLLRDITRLKEVESLKSNIVMAASHELRTPLTGLGMSIDLLLEHVAPALKVRDRELLQAAHEEVQRMKTLVDNLLDLSKIEAGRIELEFESVSPLTLFELARAIFKSQAEIKEVDLSLEPMPDLPDVRVDANKITWVLSNLISNALRYVGRGGSIKLAARRIGAQVHLSVRDNGPGIPEEYHARIFQKFVQVKGHAADGTGLGLAICKEIVRAHGGAIWVESAPGQGSTFIFSLPVDVIR